MDLVITTGQLAEQLGATLVGPDDLSLNRLDSIENAGEGSLTFIRDSAFANRWAASNASAALVSEGIEIQGHDPASRALIVVPDADLAMVILLELVDSIQPKPPAGIHERATVDPSAVIPPTASIAASVVIGANVRIGESTIVRPNTVVEHDAHIGDNCELHACVVIERDSIIGDRCIIHAGTTIGADGFGYRPAPDGTGVIKIPHVGNVIIGNDVEIGSNSCVDRAKFGATTIGDGSKIDNLVQIAHNCIIGKCCIMCGKSATSGSVTLGDGVVLGGDVKVSDNITIGPGARIAAGSGVMNDVGPGETWMGEPARPHREQVRLLSALRRVARGQAAKPGRELGR